MGNLVPSGGNAVATTGANPWAEAAKGVETGAYLKFNGNDGRWSFGQDDEDLPEGSRAVADMDTLAFGWMCWVESAVEEEIFVEVSTGRKPPHESDLPDHGPYDDDDGWRDASSLSLVLERYGDDDQDQAVGTALLWKSSTGGQVRQVRKLSGAYGKVFSQHPDEFPIIELGAESYVPKNKKHGKLKWSPTLKIVGWMTSAELEALAPGAAGDDEPEDEPAPKQVTSRRAPAEEPADEPAPRRRAAAPVEEELPEEEPAPRRRRAAAPVEEEVEEPAPAPRRRAAAPVEDEGDDEPAPAPRRRAAAPVEDEGDDEPAPAPRRRAAAPPAEDEGDEEEPAAPAPRGRSAARGAAPSGGRRVRDFG